MSDFLPVYIPAAVGTFHMETADEQFGKSVSLLKGADTRFVCPEDKLLSVGAIKEFLSDLRPDLVVFQNLTFANAAYISEVLRLCPDSDILLWTLREPVIDGGRLRLNSLTGAFSAANTLHAFGRENFTYVFGAPDECGTVRKITAAVRASEIKHNLKSLKIAAVGHTPQGFGFGRALDAEMMSVFGAELLSVEAREIIETAKSVTDGECVESLDKTTCATCGFDATPCENRTAHAKLYRAYTKFIEDNGIGALASRCWPDFFTSYGTPVCAVLSMLNDDGIAAACEADVYGALSMWIGMQLSGKPTFFGDPVSLDENENTITFWHCGAAACSMAREDTGAVVGVHPNRKIGPAMDFGCRGFGDATIFRIGRKPDGGFRFFAEEGTALDKPKQFTGTSIVIRTDGNSRDIVENSVHDGWEPHFVVIQGRYGEELKILEEMLNLNK